MKRKACKSPLNTCLWHLDPIDDLCLRPPTNQPREAPRDSFGFNLPTTAVEEVHLSQGSVISASVFQDPWPERKIHWTENRDEEWMHVETLGSVYLCSQLLRLDRPQDGWLRHGAPGWPKRPAARPSGGSPAQQELPVDVTGSAPGSARLLRAMGKFSQDIWRGVGPRKRSRGERSHVAGVWREGVWRHEWCLAAKRGSLFIFVRNDSKEWPALGLQSLGEKWFITHRHPTCTTSEQIVGHAAPMQNTRVTVL